MSSAPSSLRDLQFGHLGALAESQPHILAAPLPQACPSFHFSGCPRSQILNPTGCCNEGVPPNPHPATPCLFLSICYSEKSSLLTGLRLRGRSSQKGQPLALGLFLEFSLASSFSYPKVQHILRPLPLFFLLCCFFREVTPTWVCTAGPVE